MYNRRWFCAGGLALAGCGFTPAYGPAERAPLYGQVLVQAPKNRTEFEFVRAMETRLGLPPEAPQYRLKYTLQLTQESTIVSAEQEINRFNIRGRLTYTLSNAQNTSVAQGSIPAFTGYSSSGTTIATESAQKDAQNRLVTILADQLISRLIVDVTP
ncbi:MAG: LPS assembly lipoprotein LptE [Pseudomonadota bacterium]